MRAHFAALMSALIAAAVPLSAQDAPKYLAFDNGTTYALAADGGRLAARAIVHAEPTVDLALVTLSVADVVVDGRHDPALVTCITVSPEFRANSASAVVIAVTCSHRRPDDYDVTLAVANGAKVQKKTPARGSSAPGQSAQPPATTASDVQRIAIKLTRPVPALRTIANQAVEQIVAWPGETSSAPSKLTITETSNRVLPMQFTATQVDSATIGARPVSGRLKFTSASTDAEGHAFLPLSIEEAFPLGKATTTVEIRSNDLAAPIYVAYDVTTKLHAFYLVVAIFFGLLLGYVTRTKLKAVVERGNAAVAALDLKEKIQAARDRWRKADFRSAIDPSIAALDTALAARDPAGLKTAVTNADADFTAQMAKLQQEVDGLLRKIETNSAFAASAAKLPRPIAAALQAAAAPLEAAGKQVLRGDVDDGSATFAKAVGTMASAVEAAAATWRTTLQRGIAEVRAAAPLPADLQATAASALATVENQISKLPPSTTTPDVGAILEAVHTIRYVANHEVGERVLTGLLDVAARVVGILPGGAPNVTTAAAALRKALQEDVDTTLAEPATHAALLLAALKQDITAAAAAVPRVDVTADLAAGRYVEAATAVASAGRVTAGTVDPVATRIGQFAVVPPFSVGTRFIPGVSVGTHEPVTVARARTFREIAVAKASQFAIAATGIMVIGMITLVPAFDGAWRGVALGFLWGYAADISVDALTDAARKVK